MTQSYPLKWPEGWKRADYIGAMGGSFQVTFDKARQDLYRELSMLGAENVVISSWLELRMDGQPRADKSRMALNDPGVALYFTLRGRQMTMARDVYSTVLANLRSIGLAVAHLRGLERHGGAAMMERAFEGFAALPPPPPSQRPWREVLGLPDGVSGSDAIVIAEALFRNKSKSAHPDAGGSQDKFTELNRAINDARKELAA